MMRQGPFPAAVILFTPINLELVSRFKAFLITQTRNLPSIIPLQTTTCSNLNEQSIFSLLLLGRPAYNEKCIFKLNI